ncbi:hypothetical protein ACS0TY_006508 [Phlomoides rotata]
MELYHKMCLPYVILTYCSYTSMLGGKEVFVMQRCCLMLFKRTHIFRGPQMEKCILVDAALCNYECFLAPYRSTRYHLQEYMAAGVHPTTPQELFNLRHS